MKVFNIQFEIINNEVTQEDIERFKSVLPEFIYQRCIKFKSLNTQYLKLKGWEFIHDNRSLENGILFQEKGKPYYKDHVNQFNVSNSKGIVLTAFGKQEVGVDVEVLKEPRPNIYSRVFTDNEITWIEQSQDQAVEFTRLWTRKESVVKLIGGGISMGLTSFEVLEDQIIAFGKSISIEEVQIGEGYIAHLAYYS
jgi:phosphopantetheinyl transferase